MNSPFPRPADFLPAEAAQLPQPAEMLDKLRLLRVQVKLTMNQIILVAGFAGRVNAGSLAQLMRHRAPLTDAEREQLTPLSQPLDVTPDMAAQIDEIMGLPGASALLLARQQQDQELRKIYAQRVATRAATMAAKAMARQATTQETEPPVAPPPPSAPPPPAAPEPGPSVESAPATPITRTHRTAAAAAAQAKKSFLPSDRKGIHSVTEDQVAQFLAKGGKLTVIPPAAPAPHLSSASAKAPRVHPNVVLYEQLTSPAQREILARQGITTLVDFADLAGDELQELLDEDGLDAAAANAAIMKARAALPNLFPPVKAAPKAKPQAKAAPAAPKPKPETAAKPKPAATTAKPSKPAKTKAKPKSQAVAKNGAAPARRGRPPKNPEYTAQPKEPKRLPNGDLAPSFDDEIARLRATGAFSEAGVARFHEERQQRIEAGIAALKGRASAALNISVDESLRTAPLATQLLESNFILLGTIDPPKPAKPKKAEAADGEEAAASPSTDIVVWQKKTPTPKTYPLELYWHESGLLASLQADGPPMLLMHAQFINVDGAPQIRIASASTHLFGFKSDILRVKHSKVMQASIRATSLSRAVEEIGYQFSDAVPSAPERPLNGTMLLNKILVEPRITSTNQLSFDRARGSQTPKLLKPYCFGALVFPAH